MKNQKIFITYSTGNPIEETLALRMHTIGAVNGFNMLLPDRFHQEFIISDNTKFKISQSDWFILFSTGSPMEGVVSEINYALHHFNDKSKIIIVDTSNTASNPFRAWNDFTTLINFDPENQSVEQILAVIKARLHQEAFNKKQEQEEKSLLALFGVGLGLLALAAFNK